MLNIKDFAATLKSSNEEMFVALRKVSQSKNLKEAVSSLVRGWTIWTAAAPTPKRGGL